MDNPELYDPFWLPDDLGSNNTGFYDLQGVLTHQGRSSSSGHYVAWIRKKGEASFIFYFFLILTTHTDFTSTRSSY